MDADYLAPVWPLRVASICLSSPSNLGLCRHDLSYQPTRVASARVYLRAYQKAAFRYDLESRTDTEAAMEKVAGSELAVDVARDAIQVCGAYGFAHHVKGANQQLPLESIYRDAKIGEIYEGANEIQRWIVARKIFGREPAG